MSMVVVLKPFVSNGEDYVRDQLVSGDEFRNLNVLLTQRYLRLAGEGEVASAKFEGDEDEEESDEEETIDTAAADEDEEEARPARKKKLKSVVTRKVAKKTGLKARTRRR